MERPRKLSEWCHLSLCRDMSNMSLFPVMALITTCRSFFDEGTGAQWQLVVCMLYLALSWYPINNHLKNDSSCLVGRNPNSWHGKWSKCLNVKLIIATEAWQRPRRWNDRSLTGRWFQLRTQEILSHKTSKRCEYLCTIVSNMVCTYKKDSIVSSCTFWFKMQGCLQIFSHFPA